VPADVATQIDAAIAARSLVRIAIGASMQPFVFCVWTGIVSGGTIRAKLGDTTMTRTPRDTWA
jgi:hypothetical protein